MKMKTMITVTKMRGWNAYENAKEKVKNVLFHKNEGIDGIIVTVGLCIVALVICVVFKKQLTTFVENMVKGMTEKATGILDPTNV